MRYTIKHYAQALLELNGQSSELQSKLAHNLAGVLRKHHALSLGKAIVQRFAKLYRKHHGIRSLHLMSARPLNDRQLAMIHGDKTELTATIDPSLIGGIKIIVDEEIIIDGTIKNRIDQLLP